MYQSEFASNGHKSIIRMRTGSNMYFELLQFKVSIVFIQTNRYSTTTISHMNSYNHNLMRITDLWRTANSPNPLPLNIIDQFSFYHDRIDSETITNSFHQIRTVSSIETCNTQQIPCGPGCMERNDCIGGFSCGLIEGIFGYTVEHIKQDYGCSCGCQTARSNKRDQSAVSNTLWEMYKQTGGDDWYTSSNWHNSTLSYCSYFGIICSSSGDVIGVSFTNNNLMGTFPDLSSISTMAYILISASSFTGSSLPSTLTNIRDLTGIKIYANNLEGT